MSDTAPPPVPSRIGRYLVSFGSWNDPEGYMAQALVLSRLGSREMALQLLAGAQDGGFTAPDTLVGDPWLAPLRADPRSLRSCTRPRRSVAKPWRCSAPRAASGCWACGWRRSDCRRAAGGYARFGCP